MALLQPQFQIDGEFNTSGAAFEATALTVTNIISLTGPGIIEKGGYRFDQGGTLKSFATELALEMVVDGIKVFDEFFDNADEILQRLDSGVFEALVTGADDILDFEFSRIGFKTSFVIRIRNDDSVNAVFDAAGATLWHKGV